MSNPSPASTADVVAREITHEQAHVDRVYAELSRASDRASLVAADGMSRGRTDRRGDIRDEEITGLFERDALVFNAARRQATLDQQYEGLVFGRLDMVDLGANRGTPAADLPDEWWLDADREVRYIGRLGVRDEDYEPLVVDWRAPAASAFYRATPVEPMGVIRRRVLRSSGSRVIGVEDDLMAPSAPDDLVITGDGALMAALTRTRGSRMRDIVATIQRHQDEAIRAPGRGVTEITGGPGTGKTVVALHRAAYLLYNERRRYEAGGVLVIGPSSAYTAYIERVLPSLGEDSVTLRSLGDVVDAVSTGRLDRPEVSAIKGTLRVRRLLERAAGGRVPGAPESFRAFVGGQAINLNVHVLDDIRRRALRGHARIGIDQHQAIDRQRDHDRVLIACPGGNPIEEHGAGNADKLRDQDGDGERLHRQFQFFLAELRGQREDGLDGVVVDQVGDQETQGLGQLPDLAKALPQLLDRRLQVACTMRQLFLRTPVL